MQADRGWPGRARTARGEALPPLEERRPLAQASQEVASLLIRDSLGAAMRPELVVTAVPLEVASGPTPT